MPTGYYGNDWTTYLTAQRNMIARRTIDDVRVLITQLLRQWLAWDKVESILYRSLCNEHDTTCPRLLRGAFRVGLQASVMEFAATTADTLSSLAIGDSTQHPTLARAVSELMLAYENYLRPQLLNIQLLSLQVMQSSL